NGTTDADGRASIDIPYNDFGDQATEVDIEGRVVGQGKEQALEFGLRVRAETDEPPDPDPIGLDVIPGKDMFDFDKAVNLPATAYFDGDIHGSSTVYWYAYTQHAVLNKGEKNTKVDGTFSVDFRTPDKGTLDLALLTTHFQAPIEDGETYYHDDTEFLMVSSFTELVESDNPYDGLRQFKDSAVKVSVDKLEKGKDIPVTVTYDKGDEEWTVAVIVGNDPNPGNMGLVPGWTYWSLSPMTGAYVDMCEYDGSKWTANIFLPENLPNKDFYVGGLCVNQNLFLSSIISGNAADYVKTNYVDGLDIGQSGSSGGNGGDSLFDRLMEEFLFGIPLLYWIFILVIIVILGIVVGLMTTRKREPREMEDPGLEPTGEGPTFEGGLGAAAMPMPDASYDQMQPVAAQADYGVPPPVAPAQPEYAPPVGATAYETQQPAPAPAPYSEYGAPLPPAEAPAPEPVAPPTPDYAAPPTPDYAAPPPPVAPAQPEYAAPAASPPAVAPPVPQYAEAPPVAPPPVAPPPAAAPPAAEPVDPQVPPPTPEVPPAAPPPAAAPAPAAPAAPAAAAGATMTIRCQKCQTTLTIPRKRPIKVTCPKCGASGVLR
ncbi:MAG: hypothetical protein KAJ35_05700, partial [Thermoplasmata archaeon]|nr:hypothetical protein [Thermoplasmata archaeon]